MTDYQRGLEATARLAEERAEEQWNSLVNGHASHSEWRRGFETGSYTQAIYLAERIRALIADHPARHRRDR